MALKRTALLFLLSAASVYITVDYLTKLFVNILSSFTVSLM
jgi:hypothetical protein